MVRFSSNPSILCYVKHYRIDIMGGKLKWRWYDKYNTYEIESIYFISFIEPRFKCQASPPNSIPAIRCTVIATNPHSSPLAKTNNPKMLPICQAPPSLNFPCPTNPIKIHHRKLPSSTRESSTCRNSWRWSPIFLWKRSLRDRVWINCKNKINSWRKI